MRRSFRDFCFKKQMPLSVQMITLASGICENDQLPFCAILSCLCREIAAFDVYMVLTGAKGCIFSLPNQDSVLDVFV